MEEGKENTPLCGAKKRHKKRENPSVLSFLHPFPVSAPVIRSGKFISPGCQGKKCFFFILFRFLQHLGKKPSGALPPQPSPASFPASIRSRPETASSFKDTQSPLRRMILRKPFPAAFWPAPALVPFSQEAPRYPLEDHRDRRIGSGGI